MITEDYVNKEIAILLRDKGFNEPCDFIYDEDNLKWVYHAFIFLSDGGLATNSKLKDIRGEIVTAPTIQMALKWLREEKEVYITIIYGDYPSLNKVFWTPQIDSLEGFDLPDSFYKEYDRYEDASQAAIKYALENLI